jgi:hypothetical protein
MNLMATLRFDSTDLGRTEEFLSMAYTKMHIGGHAERTRALVTREAVGSLSVDELAFAYDMSHHAHQSIGKVCLCSVHSGGIVRQYSGGTEGAFGAGDVFMYAPHDRPYAGVIQGARYNLVMFDPRLLDQVAATARGRRPGPIRLTGDRPVSPAAARQLRAMTAYLRDHVLADPATCDAPLVAATASQLVAATVRRAVAYIDAHAGATVTAIAARWGFSPMARFARFYQQQYGTLPSRTLRT